MDLTKRQSSMVETIKRTAGRREVEVHESAGGSILVLVRMRETWQSSLIVYVGPRGACDVETLPLTGKGRKSRDSRDARSMIAVYGKDTDGVTS